MNTLTEVAEKCANYIRMIGTLVEWNVDVYEKNGTAVVKYIGVVNCNNAYINIKGLLTQYDDLCKGFIDEFKDSNIGCRVYIYGALNSQGGVTVSYITKVNDVDRFEGQVFGIPMPDNKVLVVDNEYHKILPLRTKSLNSNMITLFELSINPLQINETNEIINDGYPPIISNPIVPLDESAIVAQGLINQALEEHEIYIESMRQRTNG